MKTKLIALIRSHSKFFGFLISSMILVSGIISGSALTSQKVVTVSQAQDPSPSCPPVGSSCFAQAGQWCTKCTGQRQTCGETAGVQTVQRCEENEKHLIVWVAKDPECHLMCATSGPDATPTPDPIGILPSAVPTDSGQQLVVPTPTTDPANNINRNSIFMCQPETACLQFGAIDPPFCAGNFRLCTQPQLCQVISDKFSCDYQTSGVCQWFDGCNKCGGRLMGELQTCGACSAVPPGKVCDGSGACKTSSCNTCISKTESDFRACPFCSGSNADCSISIGCKPTVCNKCVASTVPNEMACPDESKKQNNLVPNSYTNTDFSTIIESYTKGLLSALDVGKYLSVAIRTPGIQSTYWIPLQQ